MDRVVGWVPRMQVGGPDFLHLFMKGRVRTCLALLGFVSPALTLHFLVSGFTSVCFLDHQPFCQR